MATVVSQAQPGFLYPDWEAPDNVVAMTTLRFPGVSKKNYKAGNVATHVGDRLADVLSNRRSLQKALEEGVDLQWLNQVHGKTLVQASKGGSIMSADAMFTTQPGIACCIMVADCLPVLMTTTSGRVVAAVHCGWRGLAAGILENTVRGVFEEKDDVIAWLGPAIGACHFEVGAEVREAFEDSSNGQVSDDLKNCFRPAGQVDKYMADLYQIARVKLSKLGISSVFGGGFCTFCQESEFFSHRRLNPTGRMTSLIYIKPKAVSVAGR